jgi:hypothetical protein
MLISFNRLPPRLYITSLGGSASTRLLWENVINPRINVSNMAEDDLRKAKRLLERYAEDNKCGWCRKKARILATAAGELDQSSPEALEFAKKMESKTKELSRLGETLSEISETKNQRQGLSDRLDDILSRAKGDLPDSGSRGVGVTNSQNVNTIGGPPLRQEFDRRLPFNVVTPDEVGRDRSERYARYRSEVQKTRGPVRDRLLFRLWERIES